MKKIIFPALFAMFVGFTSASAQTGESVNQMQAVDFVLASQPNTSGQHTSLMDKMQKETEELIMTVTPSPLLILANMIDHKLDAVREKKANRKDHRKKNKSDCEL